MGHFALHCDQLVGWALTPLRDQKTPHLAGPPKHSTGKFRPDPSLPGGDGI